MRTLQTIDYAEAKRAVDLIVEKALADAEGRRRSPSPMSTAT